MESFGELLKSYIQAQGLTIYGISKETGIDRSFLQSVLRGTKKLPEKRFSEIVNTNFFTAAQVSELCRLYYTQRLGKNEMKRIHFIEKGILGELKHKLSQKTEYKKTDIKFYTVYRGAENVLSLIYTALNEAPIKYFVSNFAFSHKEINSMVYNVCKNKMIDTFFHYVSSDENDIILDLEMIFYSLNYAELGYLTDRHHENKSEDLMPYYILTEKYFIKYDDELEFAYIIETETLKELTQTKIKAIKRRCLQPVYKTNDALELLRLMDTATSETMSYDIIGFDNTYCPAFATPEILDAVITPYVRENPAMIAAFFSHYEMMLGETEVNNNEPCKRDILITYKSIAEFAETGRVESLPLELAGCVPKKYRAEMLSGMITDELCNYKIVNPVLFNSDYTLSFQIQNNNLMLITGDVSDDPKAFVGENIYITQDEKTVASFLNFKEYFSKSEKVHSLAASRQIIKNFIKELQAQ